MDFSKLTIKEVPIDGVFVDPNNTRRHDSKNLSAIKASISRFGQVEPLVVQKSTNIVIGGNGRLEAMKALGWEKCNIVVVDVDDHHSTALSIALNRTAELAYWDMADLTAQLKSLDDDLREVAFSDFEIPEDLKDYGDKGDEIPDTKKNEFSVALGDIWELGDHRLTCGDSTDYSVFEKLMAGSKADLIVTDPPYNVAYDGGGGSLREKILNDKLSDEQFNAFLKEAFANLYLFTREGGAFYIFYATSESINFWSAVRDGGWKINCQLAWVKNHFVFSRSDYHQKFEPILYGWKPGAAHSWYSDRKQTTVIEFDKPSISKEHPTMKPVELIKYLITNNSKAKDSVLDCFGGSGTTLIACEELGRKAYMIELDPHYCSVVINRWQQLTGKEAVRCEQDDQANTEKNTVNS